jgi:hypothetical protein
MVLFPGLFLQIPILSNIFENLKLPISYSIEGRVLIYNTDKQIVKKQVKIFIGGYSTLTRYDGYYYLRFTSPSAAKIPILFYFLDSENKDIKEITFIDLNNRIFNIQNNFTFNVK